MSITTVASPKGLTLTATAPARHRCPFVNEKDEGTVTITWLTGTKTFELHALRKHLDDWANKWADKEISHEAYTIELANDFDRVDGLGLHIKSIRTDWTTAGMPTTCSI